MCGTVYGMYGIFSGAFGERLSAEPRIVSLLNWLTGTVFIGLGVRGWRCRRRSSRHEKRPPHRV